MGINSLCFLFSFLLLSSLCYGNDKTVLEVVGHGDCADCAQSKIQPSKAFSGLQVKIDCEAQNGEFKTRGEGKLDNEGKFIVSLPNEIIENGKLKQDCFAKLHGASNTPCPTQNSIESTKLVFKTKSNGKHIFTTAQNLKFSPITCTSAFLWPHFKHPSFPKYPFYKKPCPPFYKKPLPPPVPIYKPPPYVKPFPPPVPIYKPPVPIYKPPPYVKPFPPPVPIYKPPPYVKPLPPPVPVYKPKPKPKPPVYKPKPKPPVYKPKPKPPVYKPPPYVKPFPPPVPIYKKPLPPPVPIYKPIPPIYKPFPPYHTIPKKPPCPPLPKLPPYPKIPSKYHHHPIFAPWPPHSS